ncbi:MAG: hypothetical protein GWN87_09260 [Desulfuromonadales bacterium]|nr:hypothetical protein [Desulfuromonadales bacterium]NIS40660.1 hypothetical protein [Desulfuromonadales bacterium]
MKLLMIYCERFAYTLGHRSLDDAPPCEPQNEIGDALVGFIHAEAADEENAGKVETKLVKNLKWAARKNGTERIVLHSFSHLAATKAPPEFAEELFDRVRKRLEGAGYHIGQTPFGYFLNLDLSAPGVPAARIFTEF